jgi:hypothetical protein
VKLTIHLHLVPSGRMCGVVPPLRLLGAMELSTAAGTYLSLREEDASLPPLREWELHRLRVAGHTARGQAGHIAHVHVHAGRCGRAHEPGNCEQENRSS